MNLDLTGKTALVTASTGGIGLATATGLAQRGRRRHRQRPRASRVDQAMAKDPPRRA